MGSESGGWTFLVAVGAERGIRVAWRGPEVKSQIGWAPCSIPPGMQADARRITVNGSEGESCTEGGAMRVALAHLGYKAQAPVLRAGGVTTFPAISAAGALCLVDAEIVRSSFTRGAVEPSTAATSPALPPFGPFPPFHFP